MFRRRRRGWLTPKTLDTLKAKDARGRTNGGNGGIMAISSTEFRFLAYAFRSGLFPPHGSVLEFGEAQTVNLNVPKALGSVMSPGLARDHAVANATELAGKDGSGFALAKLIYLAVLNYTSYAAIDLEPGPSYRIQQDLNHPFDLGTRYDICINNGTFEHVFNQANVYKAIHDHTRAGGLMMHYAPSIGCFNHGLFNIQPGFILDLASANDYEIRLAVLSTSVAMYPIEPKMGITAKTLAEHPDLSNAYIHAILRKRSDRPFAYPLQGMYENLKAYVTPAS